MTTSQTALLIAQNNLRIMEELNDSLAMSLGLVEETPAISELTDKLRGIQRHVKNCRNHVADVLLKGG
jgi:hypothetical protein